MVFCGQFATSGRDIYHLLSGIVGTDELKLAAWSCFAHTTSCMFLPNKMVSLDAPL